LTSKLQYTQLLMSLRHNRKLTVTNTVVKENDTKIRYIVCKEIKQADFHTWYPLPREWRKSREPNRRRKSDDFLGNYYYYYYLVSEDKNCASCNWNIRNN
jgi:hypothetical protein